MRTSTESMNNIKTPTHTNTMITKNNYKHDENVNTNNKMDTMRNKTNTYDNYEQMKNISI